MQQKEMLWSRDYIFVLLCVMFAAFTHISYTSLFTVHVLDVGGDYVTAGWMATAMTVSGVITRLIFGPLIDRWGRKKTLALGAVLFTLGTLAYCFVSDLRGLFVLRVISGITQGIYFSVPATLIADIVPKHRLVDAMGFFGIASALTSAFGPMAGLYLYEECGARTMFVVITATAAIAMVFALLIREHFHAQPKRAEKRPRGAASVLEFSVMIPSLVALLMLMCNSALTNYVIPCGMERNIAQISLYFTVNNVTIIVMRLLTGRLAEKFGRSRMILLGILITAAGIGVISVASNLALVIVSAVLTGVGYTLFSQLMQASVLQSVPDHRRGVANSTYALMSEIGTGAGSSLWGGTVQFMGYAATYALAAVVALGAGAVQMISGSKRKIG